MRSVYLNKSGRNNTGSIVIRARGNKKLKYVSNIYYSSVRFKGVALILGIFRQKTNTVFIGLLKFSTGVILQCALIHGLYPGKYMKTIMIRPYFLRRYIKPGTRILIKLVNNKVIFSQLYGYSDDRVQYIRSAGTYTRVYQRYRDKRVISCKFPTGFVVILSFMTLITLGRNSNIKHKKRFLTKAGININFGFKPKVRGVAMNPVDHPHGGRTKSNSPEMSP